MNARARNIIAMLMSNLRLVSRHGNPKVFLRTYSRKYLQQKLDVILQALLLL